MELLKGVTSDHDLIELASKLNIHLDGILMMSEIRKPLGRGSYIILLNKGNDIGHWVAYHDNEYFDSMGIGAPRVLGDLKYNQIQYQGTYATHCGIWCLLFLYARQKNKPELLKGFHNFDIDVI